MHRESPLVRYCQECLGMRDEISLAHAHRNHCGFYFIWQKRERFIRFTEASDLIMIKQCIAMPNRR